VVRLLLECGASRTERNDAGATALDLARLLGRTDLVGLLTSLDEPTGLPTRAPAIATREHP
jgi:ankyrin repeat protein